MAKAHPDKGLGPMSQHFLLGAAARWLSLSNIFRMTDDEARDTFKRVRWPQQTVSRSARIAVA